MLKLVTALSLMRAARKRSDVDAGIGRTAVALFASWMTPALVLRRDERVVEADPESLGWLFEDTDWMWWWIRTTVKLPVYTALYVRVRGHSKIEMGPAITSGDEAFDARFVAQRHPSMPDCEDVAKSILESATVRRLLGMLITADGDECTVGSHVSLTRRRTDASFEDVASHMEKVGELAGAMEAVFAGTSPYR